MRVSKTVSDRVMIDADIKKQLISNLELVPLPSASRERIRKQLMKRIRHTPAEPYDFVTVRTIDGEWIEIAAGVFMKSLIDNSKLRASLYRMLPGSSFPAHDHPSDEECICLQGEVNLGGIAIKAGDFHFAPSGLSHGKITTIEGCLLYVRSGAASLA